MQLLLCKQTMRHEFDITQPLICESGLRRWVGWGERLNEEDKSRTEKRNLHSHGVSIAGKVQGIQKGDGSYQAPKSQPQCLPTSRLPASKTATPFDMEHGDSSSSTTAKLRGRLRPRILLSNRPYAHQRGDDSQVLNPSSYLIQAESCTNIGGNTDGGNGPSTPAKKHDVQTYERRFFKVAMEE